MLTVLGTVKGRTVTYLSAPKRVFGKQSRVTARFQLLISIKCKTLTEENSYKLHEARRAVTRN